MENLCGISTISTFSFSPPINFSYCYAVKRNPVVIDKVTGVRRQLKRSAYNDNKTRLLRGPLYKKLGKDPTISFCYSDDPEKDYSDEVIIDNWIKNKAKEGSTFA